MAAGEPRVSPDDVVQATFLAALGQLDGVRGCVPETMAAWLEVIAARAMLDAANRERRLKRGGGHARDEQRLGGAGLEQAGAAHTRRREKSPSGELMCMEVRGA